MMPIRSFLNIVVVFALTATACSLRKNRPDPVAEKNNLELALAELSLVQLDQAALAFRVAFDNSLESWQGPTDDTVPGCKISGPEAEIGLAAIKPWIDRRAAEEAAKLVDSPKNYRLPIDDQKCERDCSCGTGLKVLEAARLEDQSHSKVKELKRLRLRLEAKAELLTRDRAELCAEGSTWICGSNLLKALNPSREAR